MKLTKIFLAVLFSLVLLFALCSASFAETYQWQPNLGSFTKPDMTYEPENMPKPANPQWSTDIKKTDTTSSNNVIAEGSMLWVNSPTGIKAMHIKSGIVLWHQPVNVHSVIKVNGLIIAISKTNHLTAFDEISGRVKWKKKLDNKNGHPYTASGDLYVFWEKGLIKLDPKTGKQLWAVSKPNSFAGGQPVVFDHVVLQGYAESGAITVGVQYAFDRGTGKQLWRDTVSAPLARIGDKIYVQNIMFMSMDYDIAAEIKVIDIFTGKISNTYKYPRPASRPAVDGASWPNKVVIDNGYIYIDVDGEIVRYPLGADPNRTSGENIMVSGVKYKWIAGPIANFLIHEYETYGLQSLAADRRTDKGYAGFISPVTRVEVQGRALISGQLVGRILVHDFLNSNIKFVAKLDARNFKSMSQAGDYLVVEADNKVYVYYTPEVAKLVKQKIVPAEAKPVKGSAKFLINGKKTDIGVDPIYVNNQMLVPLRVILETLGAKVQYEAKTKQITCTKGDKTIVLKIHENMAALNGEDVGVTPAPEILEDTAYVPLRSISQLFDYTVKWTYYTKTVEINQ